MGAREWGQGTSLGRAVGVQWRDVCESALAAIVALGADCHERHFFHPGGYGDGSGHGPASWRVVGACSSSEGSLQGDGSSVTHRQDAEKKGCGFSLPPPPLPSAERRVICRRLGLVRHAAGVSILPLTHSCVIPGE